jgi:hypothetical protein
MTDGAMLGGIAASRAVVGLRLFLGLAAGRIFRRLGAIHACIAWKAHDPALMAGHNDIQPKRLEQQQGNSKAPSAHGHKDTRILWIANSSVRSNAAGGHRDLNGQPRTWRRLSEKIPYTCRCRSSTSYHQKTRWGSLPQHGYASCKPGQLPVAPQFFQPLLLQA